MMTHILWELRGPQKNTQLPRTFILTGVSYLDLNLILLGRSKGDFSGNLSSPQHELNGMNTNAGK
jgi:hypothetical protein